jgi:hypothetical protein
MTDEEKLRVSVDAFKQKLDRIQTWDDFKTLLDNITKQQVKNFLKTRLQFSADGYRDGAIYNTNAADDLDDLVTEYDSI